MEVNTLFLQLHKLSAAISEETLEHVLQTLWKTRKTGLRTEEKSSIQTILNLPSVEELDPVLACLRSLIRKCVHENLTGDNIMKLCPPDLSLDLQSIIVLLLQKFQNQWKEDTSRDQSQCQRTRISYQVAASIPPPFSSFSASETSLPVWPRQEDSIVFFNHGDVSNCTPIISTTNVSRVASLSLQQDDGLPDNMALRHLWHHLIHREFVIKLDHKALIYVNNQQQQQKVILPRLKSMTWTMENRSSTPANRVAVISLKLQDYSKSPSGETEVKFQLTRDTLEAMLRSMAYISDQLANIAGPLSEPLQKKQRQ